MFLTDPTTIRKAYAPVLLERKAARILKSMDEEKARGVVIRISMDATDRQYVCLIFMAVYAYILNSWKAVISKALVRPFKLFIYEPIVQLLGLYMAFLYGCLYCMHAESVSCISSYTFLVFLTTISTTFQDVYHDRVGVAGLHYLALGIGISIPSQINARLMDRIYTVLKARNGGIGKPEFRLRMYR